MSTLSTLRKAFAIVCGLMNGDIYYGIDSDKLFELVMKDEKIVNGDTINDWVARNIDRFSDEDSTRNAAIARIGY